MEQLHQLRAPGLPEPLLRLYTAFHMAEVTYHAVVWIGVVGVAPQDGCELLAPNEGAFINFLTLAHAAAHSATQRASSCWDTTAWTNCSARICIN